MSSTGSLLPNGEAFALQAESEPPSSSNKDAVDDRIVRSCSCGNIQIVRKSDRDTSETRDGTSTVEQVGVSDITIRYDELSLWKSERTEENPTGRRESQTRSRSPGKPLRRESKQGHITTGNQADVDDVDDVKVLTCLVCGKQVARSGTKKGEVEVVIHAQQSSIPTHPSKLLHLALPPQVTPSTFGSPSRSSTPPLPTSYLPSLPDPFFLPPPFTPGHPYFDKLARAASTRVMDLRARAEAEIKDLIIGKRRQAEKEESEIRGEVEFFWKVFEAGQKSIGVDPTRVDLDEGQLTAVGGDRMAGRPSTSATSPSRNFSPAQTRDRTSFGSGTTPHPGAGISPPGVSFGGAGSLLSASLSTHGFYLQPRQAAKDPAETPRASTPAIRSPTSTIAKLMFEQNSITMPYQQRKSGVDLDVAASMRVSHLGDLYDQQENNGSTHNRPDTRDRRYYDPGADVENAVSSIRDERSPSLGRREKVEREGGKGDIELNPFAESSQVSAASSYQGSNHGDRPIPPSVVKGDADEEQLRTPRGRAVKPIGESISPARLGPSTTRASPSPAATLKSSDQDSKNGKPPTATRLSSDGQGPVRKKVTFEEPSSQTADAVTQASYTEEEGEEIVPSETDGKSSPGALVARVNEKLTGSSCLTIDAVFDFEEHDAPSIIPELEIAHQDPRPLEGSTPDHERVEAMRRNTELVENKLIDLVAADAPSHRAAWRNNKDQLWQALGRYTSRPLESATKRIRSDDNFAVEKETEEVDTSETAYLATSVPIQIQMPRRQNSANYVLEPKTSLVERPGVLVPPLRAVMRIPTSSSSIGGRRSSSGSWPPPDSQLPADIVSEDAHNRAGSNSSSDIRRHASKGLSAGDGEPVVASSTAFSLSEKRMSFAMDPGPALEAFGSPEAGGAEVDEDDVPGGANFVPPHRQISQERDPDGMGEAGWRSLAE
ncbi:hypothetical protein QFC22_001225 [Naganishia vaughanmartiniae]|uniref:Uncharacterized protein n=1 Tax=Naganishia vaughanmartiniae TaxID=1424756 RepID=A0ACC2XHD6_9TREE|nr:hypothetical protein QFC22_001225 [Naganishia vaughanmartiniae]